MPRANRYFIPGYVWHITHRCHKREFLLKLVLDRKRWLHWLFEAKKNYGLRILNYCITSNHIHLLVIDTGKSRMAKSVQLVAGRVAQEYNQRKNRHGAFWEDRYHATAIMKDTYLLQCLLYIDLNMVRAGAVNHPSHYPYCGYNEIINPPKRYRLIDSEGLKNYCGFTTKETFIEEYKRWVDTACRNNSSTKEMKWSESIAVGAIDFINEIRDKLGARVESREIVEEDGIFKLQEPTASYTSDFTTQNDMLSEGNTLFWNIV